VSDARPAIAAIVLAAGRSRRYGAANKLLACYRGRPLVTHVVRAALASHARPVWVVTGHDAGGVRRALRGQRHGVHLSHNPAAARGMAGSLRCGLRRLGPSIAAAVVCLGDMPGVRAGDIDRLINAYRAGDKAVVPVHHGRRGHPVLLARPLFARLCQLRGDQGARAVLRDCGDIRRVDTDRAAFADIDRPVDLRQAGRRR